MYLQLTWLLHIDVPQVVEILHCMYNENLPILHCIMGADRMHDTI